MSKKAVGVTTENLNGITITINQHLHGIEVKGDLTSRQTEWLTKNGFWFSKRKGHFWRDFDGKVYKKVVNYFKQSLKNRGKSKSKMTLGQAAPINMAEAFKDDFKEDELEKLFGLAA